MYVLHCGARVFTEAVTIAARCTPSPCSPKTDPSSISSSALAFETDFGTTSASQDVASGSVQLFATVGRPFTALSLTVPFSYHRQLVRCLEYSKKDVASMRPLLRSHQSCSSATPGTLSHQPSAPPLLCSLQLLGGTLVHHKPRRNSLFHFRLHREQVRHMRRDFPALHARTVSPAFPVTLLRLHRTPSKLTTPAPHRS